jgi:3-methyladenine DNA glycosylase AlkD
MAKFGIRSSRIFGVRVPVLRRMARRIGRDHGLAQELWATRIFDARLLAAMIDEPERVTGSQMEAWVREFDNWAICDGCCLDLFRSTRFADTKLRSWSARTAEFEKRAAFSLMATLAVHDHTASDERFREYLRIIERESEDERNYVRKAVNWALRQIGKRNPALWRSAVASARRIQRRESSAARWIASDALRELREPSVKLRVQQRDARAGTTTARR